MIRKGNAQLMEWGIETDIFMAPAHTFDKNTLKALKNNGFKALTDGFGKMPYFRSGLVFYPIATKRSDCFSDKKGYTTLVLHSNMMNDRDFEILETQLKDNCEKLISYSEYRNVKVQKRLCFGHFVEYGMATVKFILVRLRKR